MGNLIACILSIFVSLIIGFLMGINEATKEGTLYQEVKTVLELCEKDLVLRSEKCILTAIVVKDE